MPFTAESRIKNSRATFWVDSIFLSISLSPSKTYRAAWNLLETASGNQTRRNSSSNENAESRLVRDTCNCCRFSLSSTSLRYLPSITIHRFVLRSARGSSLQKWRMKECGTSMWMRDRQ